MEVFADDTVEEKRGDRTVDAPGRGESDLLARFHQTFHPGNRFLNKVRGIEICGIFGSGVSESVRLDLFVLSRHVASCLDRWIWLL